MMHEHDQLAAVESIEQARVPVWRSKCSTIYTLDCAETGYFQYSLEADEAATGFS